MPSPENSTPETDAPKNRWVVPALIASAVVLGICAVYLGTLIFAQPAAKVLNTTSPESPTSTESATSAESPATDTETTPAARPVPSTEAAPASVDTFNKNARSIDDPNSIWLVVNKLRPLNPENFVPPDLVTVDVAHTWSPQLRAEASAATVKMFAAASSEADLSLASNSAYRSYASQQSVYHGDDNSTARPGFSEHQTGLAIDIGNSSGRCSLDACFGDTPAGAWLRDNAYRFGFILRYPADKQEITGYEYEPWHFRYVGVELATRMHDTGVTTLEEFFGLPAAPNYTS